MMASNVTDTFSILIEAGYLFKYKDIVWQSFNDGDSDDEEEKSESESEDYFQGGLKDRKASKYSSSNRRHS